MIVNSDRLCCGAPTTTEGKKAFLQPFAYGRGFNNDICWYFRDQQSDNLDGLCFVHGSFEELLLGKICVVRNRFVRIKKVADEFFYHKGMYSDSPYTLVKKPLYQPDDGVYKSFSTKYAAGKGIIVGVSQNGNTKIKLFT